jgi:hypothetical protein
VSSKVYLIAFPLAVAFSTRKSFQRERKGRAHHLYTIVPAAAIVMGRTPLVGVNIGYQNRGYAVAVRRRFRLVATK